MIAEEHNDALTLPATAVVREGEKAYCVVVADGRAARRAVELGLNDGSGRGRLRPGRGRVGGEGERRLAHRRPARRAGRTGRVPPEGEDLTDERSPAPPVATFAATDEVPGREIDIR